MNKLNLAPDLADELKTKLKIDNQILKNAAPKAAENSKNIAVPTAKDLVFWG